MRHIFLEKSYTKCGGELFIGLFLKNQIKYTLHSLISKPFNFWHSSNNPDPAA